MPGWSLVAAQAAVKIIQRGFTWCGAGAVEDMPSTTWRELGEGSKEGQGSTGLHPKQSDHTGPVRRHVQIEEENPATHPDCLTAGIELDGLHVPPQGTRVGAS
jgi:hypothetical protein